MEIMEGFIRLDFVLLGRGSIGGASLKNPTKPEHIASPVISITLPETNKLPLKMVGVGIVLFWDGLVSGVGFREGTQMMIYHLLFPWLSQNSH